MQLENKVAMIRNRFFCVWISHTAQINDNLCGNAKKRISVYSSVSISKYFHMAFWFSECENRISIQPISFDTSAGKTGIFWLEKTVVNELNGFLN